MFCEFSVSGEFQWQGHSNHVFSIFKNHVFEKSLKLKVEDLGSHEHVSLKFVITVGLWCQLCGGTCRLAGARDVNCVLSRLLNAATLPTNATALPIYLPSFPSTVICRTEPRIRRT